jgi:hypothetical protein
MAGMTATHGALRRSPRWRIPRQPMAALTPIRSATAFAIGRTLQSLRSPRSSRLGGLRRPLWLYGVRSLPSRCTSKR